MTWEEFLEHRGTRRIDGELPTICLDCKHLSNDDVCAKTGLSFGKVPLKLVWDDSGARDCRYYTPRG